MASSQAITSADGSRTEVTLDREVSAATDQWPDVEHTQRSLFNNMLNALAHCRIITAPDGCPVDFEFLEVNHAFVDVTGIPDPIGRRASEVLPDLHAQDPQLLTALAR